MGREKRLLVFWIIRFSITLIAVYIFYEVTMKGSQLYNFFKSPLWGSAGAIITGIGVFIGAWLGAKFGMESTQELNKKQIKEEAKVKYRAFRREVTYNSSTIDQISNFLTDVKKPSPLCFNAIKTATNHFRRGAWEEFMKVGSYDGLNLDLIKACVDFEIALSTAHRDIQMDISDWEKICEFNDQVKDKDQRFKEIKSNMLKNIKNVSGRKEFIEEKESGVLFTQWISSNDQ